MSEDTSLIEYYARRANEYERIYAKPERQADLRILHDWLQAKCARHDVLEVACGTGYWTEAIATTANSVTAADINREVLEIARCKNFPRRNVSFEQLDVYQLALNSNHFTAGLAAFWWSHIPKAKVKMFLQQFHQNLRPDALVVFVDNLFVEDSSRPISRCDDEGNSYQLRTLDDGSRHEVLKNFPTETELRNAVEEFARDIEYCALDYYWCLAYRLKSNSCKS